MHHQIAPTLALALVVSCDPQASPCSDTSTGSSSDTGTDTGTDTGPGALCCDCPSGTCWPEQDEAACVAAGAASGSESAWCDGDASACLTVCSATTVCCQCAIGLCQVWPHGEAACFAAAGAGALWCEDATPDGCATLCAG